MADFNEDVKILLVEDNAFDAELAIISLKKNALAGNLHHVSTGPEALDFLFRRGQYSQRTTGHNPKMILLDLNLPTLSGLEVLKQIKSNESTQKIPVVVLTSSDYNDDLNACFEFGANSCIVKPVEFDTFRQTIGSLASYWLCLNESK